MAKHKLEDICEFITDGTHQTPEYCDENGVIFLSSKDVTERKIDWDNVKYIPKALHEQLYKRLKPQKNDILLAKNGTTGVAAIVDRDEVFDVYVSLAVLRPKPDIYPKYLLYAINSSVAKRQFNAGLKGIGVPNLHLSVIRKTELNIAERDKQESICQLLDKVSYLIALRQQQLEDLDNLIKARFVELFGDPIHSDKYGTRKLLSCVADKTDMVDGPFGSQVNTKVDYIENGEIPVIRTVNVKMMSFSSVDLKYMTREKYETVIRSQVLPGDVILTKVGTIGNVCIFPDTFDEAVLSTTGSCRIRVDSSIMNTEFFAYNLMYLKEKLLEIASAGVQPFLNMNHVKNIDILDVPLGKQIEFADFVKQVDKSKVVVQKALEKTKLLFDSLMQEYFG